MRQLFLTAVALLAFGGPAIAFHCPRDMAAIDAALAKNPALTAEQKDEVMTRRAEGEKLHKSGQHQDAVETLAKAMEILGIN